jgi:hypothetical protein
VLKPTATIELVYADETGSTSAVVVNVPSSSSIAIMDATATALASLIAPMTDAVLVKIRHSYRTVYQADISEAGSNAIVFAGVFIFSDFEGSNLGIVVIPAIKDAFIMTSGNGAGVLINTSDDTVFEFVNHMRTNDYSNPMGDFFFFLKAAYRQSRV